MISGPIRFHGLKTLGVDEATQGMYRGQRKILLFCSLEIHFMLEKTGSARVHYFTDPSKTLQGSWCHYPNFINRDGNTEGEVLLPGSRGLSNSSAASRGPAGPGSL